MKLTKLSLMLIMSDPHVSHAGHTSSLLPPCFYSNI